MVVFFKGTKEFVLFINQHAHTFSDMASEHTFLGDKRGILVAEASCREDILLLCGLVEKCWVEGKGGSPHVYRCSYIQRQRGR